LAYLICSDNPIFGKAWQRGIFRTVTDFGADKKTLYCVDKIHFRLFSTYLLSGGIWTPQGFGRIMTNARSAAAAPKSSPE
jgi:hypothetical protein